MNILSQYVHINFFILLLIYNMQLAYARPQNLDTLFQTLRNGRYVPELHGADRGKYVPDDSGTYRHVHIPYDGGYGDRGVAYVHIEPTRGPNGLGGLSLGPKDHLRFSVDFNFNSNGWQIVQLEYINDDDEKKRYDYKYERQLWPAEGDENTVDESDASYASSTSTPQTPAQTDTNVRVSGEYQDDIYNISYSNDNKSNGTSKANVQAVIGVVLDYIQNNILPTLT